MKYNKRLRVRVRVRFILFYSEFVPTNSRCITLQNLLLERKNYEEEMSFEQPTHTLRLKKEIFNLRDFDGFRCTQQLIYFRSGFRG